MREACDNAIIGGGAAGLAAAIFAAEARREARVVVLDGAKSLGAKILVAGGGRCNVTHDHIMPSDFNGSKNIVRNILAAFDEQATVRWFASLGVELKIEETGKLFPVTDSARTVLSALLNRCAELGVVIRPNCRVTRITPGDATADAASSFDIEHSGGATRAARIILSTGGRSLPRTGSDGGGYELAKALGHTVTDTHAALVPLTLDGRFFHAALSGIAQDVELTVLREGKPIDRRSGALLWTHFGVSGPVVMDASRFWVIANDQSAKVEMRANLWIGETFESVEAKLVALVSASPRTVLKNVLCASRTLPRLPERVTLALLEYLALDPSTSLSQLKREDRRRLIHALVALPLPVITQRGWNYAEVTAGGVPLAEIDPRSMHSRKTPGLYLAGEILDCDGRIGGFNFQWAWATGHLAGRAAAILGK